MSRWLPADEVMLAVSTMESTPQGVEVPEQTWPGGEPATVSVVPFSRPTVAPGTGTGADTAWVAMFSDITLAVVPPHSGPQFRMKAVLLSLDMAAPTGRSKPGTVATTTAGVTVVSMMATELMPSLNANTFLPSGVIASQCT